MNKKERRNLLVVIGVIAVLLLAAKQGTAPPPATISPGGAPPPPAGVSAQTFIGAVKITMTIVDSIAPTTTYREGSHVTHQFWTLESNGAYKLLGSGNATFNIDNQHGGYIYITPAIRTGQSLYQDVAAIKGCCGGRVKGYQYVDITGDQVKDFVYKLWVGDLTPIAAGQVAQDLFITTYWISQAYPTLALNNPTTTQRGVGTASNVTYTTFRETFATTNTGVLRHKLVINFNTSSTSAYQLNTATVNGQPISGDSFTSEAVGTGNRTLTYIWQTNMGGEAPVILKYPTGTANQFDTILKITWTMGGINGVVVQPYFYFWSPVEVSTVRQPPGLQYRQTSAPP